MSVKPVAWTPGPWETHYSHDVTGYPCFFIHGMSGQGKTDDATLTANARLIASAPELAEALQRMVDATNAYDKFLSDQGMHEGPNDGFAVEAEVHNAMDAAEKLLARITPK